MYKKRKETTHGQIGEEDTHYKYTHTHTHTHTHIYIKDKHNVCKQGHKTGV